MLQKHIDYQLSSTIFSHDLKWNVAVSITRVLNCLWMSSDWYFIHHWPSHDRPLLTNQHWRLWIILHYNETTTKHSRTVSFVCWMHITSQEPYMCRVHALLCFIVVWYRLYPCPKSKSTSIWVQSCVNILSNVRVKYHSCPKNNIVTCIYWHVDANAEHVTIDLTNTFAQTNYTLTSRLIGDSSIDNKTSDNNWQYKASIIPLATWWCGIIDEWF